MKVRRAASFQEGERRSVLTWNWLTQLITLRFRAWWGVIGRTREAYYSRRQVGTRVENCPWVQEELSSRRFGRWKENYQGWSSCDISGQTKLCQRKTKVQISSSACIHILVMPFTSLSLSRAILTIEGQPRSQTKPGSCFACNKPGHWRAQCPLLFPKTHTSQWLAGEQVEGVVDSSFSFSTSFYNSCDDDYLVSDEVISEIKTSQPSCEFSSGHSDKLSVRGTLAKWFDEWVKIGAPGFVLSVIRVGYQIPFIGIPSPKVSTNNISALKERVLVSKAICDLLDNRCVECSWFPASYNQPSFNFSASL